MGQNLRQISYFFLLILFALSLESCHVGRFFYWNFADVQDYKKFKSVDIKTANQPFTFLKSDLNYPTDSFQFQFRGKTYDFDSYLRKTGTLAFLVIQNDKIVLEKYAQQYNEASVIPSFSMSKSIVSLLLGKAIEEGFISSVDDKIYKYIPELDSTLFKTLSIVDVLNMRSGIKCNESYINPFGDVAKHYYGLNLKKYIKQLQVKEKPNTNFEYISINTQLLGLAIENAVGKKLNKYLEEKFWIPMGMEFPASWSIDSDKNKTIKSFCCLNARAIDFAKFGKLMLDQGLWNGNRLIAEEWIQQTISPNWDNDFTYNFQWWQGFQIQKTDENASHITIGKTISIKGKQYKSVPNGDFWAEGILGQFIYMVPNKNLIFVRMGKRYGSFLPWPRFFKRMSERL